MAIFRVTEPKHIQSVERRIVKYSSPPNENGCILWTGSNCEGRSPKLSLYVGYYTVENIYIVPYLLEKRLERLLQRGFYALHDCGVALCINELHLYEGTPKQNMQDRFRHGTMIRGQYQHMTTLTDKQVAEIKQRYNNNPYAFIGVEVAKEFDTTKRVISSIITSNSWAHIEPKIRYVRINRLPPRGGNTRLTDKHIQEIREARSKGRSNVSLAAEYGVTDSHISAIVTRRVR